MKKPLPKLWRRKRDGKEFGAFHINVRNKPVNLCTDDAQIARQRRIEAVERGARKWPRKFAAKSPALQVRATDEGAADRVLAALDGGVSAYESPAPAASASPPPGDATPPADRVRLLPPVQPEPVIEPEPILPGLGGTSWTEDVGAAAATPDPAADGSSPPPPEVSTEELAQLAVAAQVWAAQEYARAKVYRGFTAPALPDDAKEQLAAQWKKILDYGGIANLLPPWVTGLVIPGVTLAVSTFAMARGYTELAKEQKRASAQPSPTEPVADGLGAAA